MATVLWLGDAGCRSGFSRVTHAIGERLVRDYGHDVHVLAVNYRGDFVDTNLKLYVANSKMATDLYGQTRFIEMLGKVGPDVVVMLNDPNIIIDLLYQSRYDPQKILLHYRPILTYVAIDGHNQPPAWATALHQASRVVAMSEHGQRQLGEGTVLAHHGVDTDRFYPVSKDRPLTLSNGTVIHSRTEAKRAFGISPDTFFVLRIDTNSGRKDYAASWKALVPFMARHEDVRAHFHCRSGVEHGLDLHALFSRSPETHERFGLPAPESMLEGWPDEDIAGLHNAADVFLSTSRGEGFGLSLAQSLACGVPVIASNVSAIPEVVGPGGILIEPARESTTPSGQDTWHADIPAFTAALERLYRSRGMRRDLGHAGRQHVVESFSWDKTAAIFDAQISALAEGVGTDGSSDAGTAGGRGEVRDLLDPAPEVVEVA